MANLDEKINLSMAILGAICLIGMLILAASVTMPMCANEMLELRDRLSTAVELPNGDAPVPAGYPVLEVV